MTASTLVTIFCDAPSCGQWEDNGIADTAKQARAGLRRRGWALNVVNPDGSRQRLDFCPEHAQCEERHPQHPEARCRLARHHEARLHHSLMYVWPVARETA